MSVKDMMSSWVRNNNSRLVKKQTSIRLPVHAAAKIEAICEMYPNKTKTDIINDLLIGALDEVYESLPFCPGETFTKDGETWHKDQGLKNEYVELTNKHYKKIEHELGNSSPGIIMDEPEPWSEGAVDQIYEQARK